MLINARFFPCFGVRTDVISLQPIPRCNPDWTLDPVDDLEGIKDDARLGADHLPVAGRLVLKSTRRRPPVSEQNNSAKERRFIAQRSVLHATSLTLSARLVYFELDDRAGYKGSCWPGQETIAAALGISVRAVRDGIDELIDRGFVRAARGVDPFPKGLSYFLGWFDRQNLPVKVDTQTGRICRSDRQNLPVNASASLYEPKKEPKKEQRCSVRCSLCGDSGVTGATSAELDYCACSEGSAARRRTA